MSGNASEREGPYDGTAYQTDAHHLKLYQDALTLDQDMYMPMRDDTYTFARC